MVEENLNSNENQFKAKKERMRFTAIVESTEDDTFQPFGKMEGAVQRVEESKENIDLEHGLGINEDRKVDNVVLPNFNGSNDMLYHPQPVSSFFACLAALLQDAFYFVCSGSSYTNFSINGDGDGKMSARIQREMTSCNESCNDANDSPEGNAMNHSKAAQFWVRHRMDVYTRQDVCARKEGTRLYAPAPMIFTNEKLIGPPPALKRRDAIGYQRTRRKSMTFTKPDGTPLSLCRYDEMPINDDINGNETVCDTIKYADVVKQSHNMGLFGWIKPTNFQSALDVDIKVKEHEEQIAQQEANKKRDKKESFS